MPKYTENTYKDVYASVQGALDEMNDKIKNYFVEPEQLKELFEFMDGFYGYSTRNMMFIQQQYKGAKAVASFQTWKEDYGVSVKKGEHGINILVPVMYKLYDTEDGYLTFSKLSESQQQRANNNKYEVIEKRSYTFGKVFDVTQTTLPAERYPELYPNKHIGTKVENYDDIFKAVKYIVDQENVKFVPWNPKMGAAKGFSIPGEDEISLNPSNTETENILVTLHELSHAVLHDISELPKELKEYQAEMVSYLTSKHFGLDSELQTVEYLASWAKDQDVNRQVKLIDEVRMLSSYFIKHLEPKLAHL
ncbi:MAG: ArdC-like ssDNA-binding domain-containing protein, partial [Culicoidibacterales bacterium]